MGAALAPIAAVAVALIAKSKPRKPLNRRARGNKSRGFRIIVLSRATAPLPTIPWNIMNGKIGIIALMFGVVSLALAIASQSVPAGVFGMCSGVLGYLAGRASNGD